MLLFAQETNEITLWPAAIITAIILIVALTLRFRNSLWSGFTSARFFTLSLIVHSVILLALAIWSVPAVVQYITHRHKSEPGEQPFDDNQHQSHQDGQKEWEKLADVKAIDQTAKMERSEVNPTNMAGTTGLEPTLSVEEARSRRLDNVVFTAPKQTEAASMKDIQMTARTRASAGPAELPEEIEQMNPRAPTPMQPVPIRKPTLPAARKSASTLPKTTPDTPPLALNTPRTVQLANRLSTPIPAIASEVNKQASVRPSTENKVLVELKEDGDLRTRPLDNKPALKAIVKDANVLPRASAPRSTIDPRPTIAANGPRRRVPPAIAPAGVDEPLPTLKTNSPEAKRVIQQASSELNSDRGKRVVPKSSAKEDAIEIRVALPRRRHTSISGAPRSMPVGNRTRPISIGHIAQVANHAPPKPGPVVSKIDRHRAVARRVVYAADNVGLRQMFTLREGDVRKQHIALFGGSNETEKAVERGLKWLAEHQNKNGSWSLHAFHTNCKGKHGNCGGAGSVRSDSAATGLALLPFLGAGNTHLKGPYKTQVAAGLAWFRDGQQKDGNLLAKGDAQTMYSHCIATIAVCEAYGMTKDAELRPTVERALAFIVASQHAGTGGWRYNPREPADTSVVGWAMMALKSGEMAGLNPPTQALQRVASWLKRVEGNQPVGGVFGYQNRNPTPAMTAEGLLCLQFLGTPRDSRRLHAGADYLLKNLPNKNQSKTSYYWYYATQTLYHLQGEPWDRWNSVMKPLLLSTQVTSSNLSGTWHPRDNWERSGGRLYATSLRLLMLEVYYRHLPLYSN